MMKDKTASRIRSIVAHVVLIILSFMCLFFFYVLIVNASHSHAELQKGFSALPGKYFRCSGEFLTVLSCPDAVQYYVHIFPH